jgi:hypothetical protein
MGTGPSLPAGYPVERAVPLFNISRTNLNALGSFALPNGYQPVPLLVFSGNEDYAFQVVAGCPKLFQYFVSFQSAPEYQMINSNFTDYYKVLGPIFGIAPENMTLITVNYLFDSMFADYFANRPTKVAYGSDIWLKGAHIAAITLNYIMFRDIQTTKVFLQPGLQELFDGIDSKLNGSKPNMKWYQYSGHDVNIIGMLRAFNLSNCRPAPSL